MFWNYWGHLSTVVPSSDEIRKYFSNWAFEHVNKNVRPIKAHAGSCRLV